MNLFRAYFPAYRDMLMSLIVGEYALAVLLQLYAARPKRQNKRASKTSQYTLM